MKPIISVQELFNCLDELTPGTDKLEWLKRQVINDPVLSEALLYAVKNGQLDRVKLLSQVPEINLAENDNDVLYWATELGHLDIVQYLCQCSAVDPTNSGKHDIIETAHILKRNEIANYLASLPCYNPFASDITLAKKIELYDVLIKLKLNTALSQHHAHANENLRFLFFKTPATAVLNNDVKSAIVDIAVELDKTDLKPK